MSSGLSDSEDGSDDLESVRMSQRRISDAAAPELSELMHYVAGAMPVTSLLDKSQAQRVAHINTQMLFATFVRRVPRQKSPEEFE